MGGVCVEGWPNSARPHFAPDPRWLHFFEGDTLSDFFFFIQLMIVANNCEWVRFWGRGHSRVKRLQTVLSPRASLLRRAFMRVFEPCKLVKTRTRLVGSGGVPADFIGVKLSPNQILHSFPRGCIWRLKTPALRAPVALVEIKVRQWCFCGVACLGACHSQ